MNKCNSGGQMEGSVVCIWIGVLFERAVIMRGLTGANY